jgi:hypothetical protein
MLHVHHSFISILIKMSFFIAPSLGFPAINLFYPPFLPQMWPLRRCLQVGCVWWLRINDIIPSWFCFGLTVRAIYLQLRF